MLCPFRNDECSQFGCALWSKDHEECGILIASESLAEIGFAADNANFDCGIRVHVTKERECEND